MVYIPARVILYFLSWSGFVVSFMMRNDINFALTAMCSDSEGPATDDLGRKQYNWSSFVQSVIVGSFYVCYVLSQVIGGIATQKFGTKSVFGWSQFITACGSLLIPIAADFGAIPVIILRCIQGTASGLTWPSMYAIVGYWIPFNERSRFMSSFQGFSVGIGLTYPLCGFIISRFGWPVVFYTTGSIAMVWCFVWYKLAFNTPQEHPRISPSELELIEQTTNNMTENKSVPWIKIFKSLPVWSIAITTFGRIWIHYTFIVMGPIYMKHVLKFDYTENGLLTGTPFLLSYITSVIFCSAADWLITHKVMTLTNTRKLFTFISQCGPALLILMINHVIYDLKSIILIWFLCIMFITASYAGAMANIVDLAPNFAGPVLAFTQTIHMSASFLSPIINGIILSEFQSISQWQIIFELSACISMITFAVFQIFGTGSVQKWNGNNQEYEKQIPEKALLNNNDNLTMR